MGQNKYANTPLIKKVAKYDLKKYAANSIRANVAIAM
jgi:hypothetical protein